MLYANVCGRHLRGLAQNVVMNVTFVTMFIRPTNVHRSIDQYLIHFHSLANTGLPIVLFLDPTLDVPDYPNVKVVPIKYMESFPFERFPTNRSIQKDTPEYFCIQLGKLRCMTQAREYADTPYLAWIDFGVYHMFRDTKLADIALRRIATREYTHDTILSPSCWPRGDYPIWDKICWRFCGSFFLGHRDIFPKAAARQREIVIQNLPKATWEVNYWCLMEDMFTTYPADHNIRLLTELCNYVGPKATG